VDSILGVLNSVFLPNLSATTVENGYTVEEPTAVIVSRLLPCAFATLAIKATLLNDMLIIVFVNLLFIM
jgi:hypothetical protein